ncbi:RNA methyltransferase [Fastidiosibacter lacustris]|uniref:RNA methyltransferase n=1 Tax=Fastidiosibacter lacustris TaxID=2056695 RepID=UPI001959C234|nr:RNA methyltransferase [Fastidiosibacter lacustris]
MLKMLNKIRIVLIETSHTGNIGSSARAMLNMQINELYLVKPKYLPDEQALASAAHAMDVVNNAKIVSTLIEALDGVDLVIGTSARTRRMDLPMLSAQDASKEALSYAKKGLNVAILFGRERTGLFNNELLMCHLHAYIPSNEHYTSLNLAQAVQIICYELHKQFKEQDEAQLLPKQSHIQDKASIKDVQAFYTQLEQKLIEVGFLNPDKPGQVVDRLKRLFQRAQLESQEIKILRGFLSQIKGGKK